VEEAAKFSNFSNDDVVEKTLPSSVRIEVWTAKQHQVAKSGVAYLYFFPQGYTERAQIGLRQGDNVFTITVAPLTGKTGVVGKALEVPRS
jgi:general secretion pathway protein H